MLHRINVSRAPLELIVCLGLAVATLAVFGGVRNHEFITYDDDAYVTNNRHVQAGLTWKGVIWSLTTTQASNWHPLTWLSHMLDCQIYGLQAGGHHLTTLLLHIVNALLLFLVLEQMTGAMWRATVVAALFALHPLHVESVAWVAERKDVLSTLFWMMTMWAYVRYVKCPGFSRYLLTLLLFALGLMAKPMLVTLPFVLLLIDYWPLGRFNKMERSGDSTGVAPSRRTGEAGSQRSLLFRLIREKAPLFVLAGVSSIVTFVVQKTGGAVWSLEAVPITMRVANALISYVYYIGKMVWPQHLAVFYPYETVVPVWQGLGAGLFLVGVSFLALREVRRLPYISVGWLWYVGTLVPVIGLVQVGEQAMADRYTYIPLIGLFIVVVWGAVDLARKWRHKTLLLGTSAGGVLLACMICTHLQVSHWRTTMTLFQHALDVTANNYLAYNNVANVLASQGKLQEAVASYSEALRIKPDYVNAHNNLGTTLDELGRFGEAVAHFSEALRIKPDFAEAHNNLGIALVARGEIDKAIAHHSEALRIRPDYAGAHNCLGVALAMQGKLEEAVAHFSEAIRIAPDDAEARHNLDLVLRNGGNREETSDTSRSP
jgi:tetratricopeptide (TPR) repeat protein